MSKRDLSKVKPSMDYYRKLIKVVDKKFKNKDIQIDDFKLSFSEKGNIVKNDSKNVYTSIRFSKYEHINLDLIHFRINDLWMSQVYSFPDIEIGT